MSKNRHWENRWVPGIIDDIIADRTMSYEDTVHLVAGLVASLKNRGLDNPVDDDKVAVLTGIIVDLTGLRNYFSHLMEIA